MRLGPWSPLSDSSSGEISNRECHSHGASCTSNRRSITSSGGLRPANAPRFVPAAQVRHRRAEPCAVWQWPCSFVLSSVFPCVHRPRDPASGPASGPTTGTAAACVGLSDADAVPSHALHSARRSSGRPHRPSTLGPVRPSARTYHPAADRRAVDPVPTLDRLPGVGNPHCIPGTPGYPAPRTAAACRRSPDPTKLATRSRPPTPERDRLAQSATHRPTAGAPLPATPAHRAAPSP